MPPHSSDRARDRRYGKPLQETRRDVRRDRALRERREAQAGERRRPNVLGVTEIECVHRVVSVAQHLPHVALGGPLRAAPEIAMGGEIGGSRMLEVRERVVSVGHQDQLVLGELESQELWVGRTLDDRAVQRAGQDASVQVGRRLDDDAQLDAGVAARELGKVGRDVVSGAGGAGAQVERSRLQLLGGLGRVLDDLDGPQRRTTGFGEGAASSWTPTACSKCRICWVTAPWVRKSDAAAREMCSLSATATNERNCSSVNAGLRMPIY